MGPMPGAAELSTRWCVVNLELSFIPAFIYYFSLSKFSQIYGIDGFRMYFLGYLNARAI